ncbi:adult-specific rigid cuticular protein 15.7, partial [Caerostris extrusa]
SPSSSLPSRSSSQRSPGTWPSSQHWSQHQLPIPRLLRQLRFRLRNQDGLGATNSRSEVGDAHGNKKGSYTIADIDGRARRVDYVADGHGFRATVKTNEPGTAASVPAAVLIASPYAGPVAPVVNHVAPAVAVGHAASMPPHWPSPSSFAALVAVQASGLLGHGHLVNTGVSTSSQSRDAYGNYAFGYGIKDGLGATNSRSEVGDAHGNKKGSYTIADIDGRARRVDYVADGHGFRATVKTNEPGTAASAPAAALIASPYAGPAAPVVNHVAPAAALVGHAASYAAPLAVAAPVAYGGVVGHGAVLGLGYGNALGLGAPIGLGHGGALWVGIWLGSWQRSHSLENFNSPAQDKIDVLERLQNRALRIITGAVKTAPVAALQLYTVNPSIYEVIKKETVSLFNRKKSSQKPKWIEVNYRTCLENSLPWVGMSIRVPDMIPFLQAGYITSSTAAHLGTHQYKCSIRHLRSIITQSNSSKASPPT